MISLGLSFWSGTRAAVVSVATALSIAAALNTVIRTRKALTTITIAAFGGAALSLVSVPPDPSYGIFRMTSALGTGDINQISSRRWEIWKLAWLQIAERPLLGHGAAAVDAPGFTPTGKVVQPHNSVLQMLLQWGAIGAVCFFSLIGALWLRMSRALARDPEAHLGMFLIATGLLVQSLFEGMLFFPYPVMMTVFALAASAAITRPAPVAGTSRSPAPKSADREATGSG
jgi:O-antigen ligase